MLRCVAEELLLTRYERAWNRHDPHACSACFTDDAVRESLLSRSSESESAPRVFRGRQEIDRAISECIAAFPDVVVEIVSVGYGSDRRLWTEWSVRGTHTGDFGQWRASGRRIEVLGVSVFRLSNAGFLEERLYWDTAALTDAAGGAGTATAAAR